MHINFVKKNMHINYFFVCKFLNIFILKIIKIFNIIIITTAYLFNILNISRWGGCEGGEGFLGTRGKRYYNTQTWTYLF